jgi:tRNA (cmo5U34)-methyltransferase
MLEKMGEFFDNRLEIYDEHQLNCIDSAREFLQFTADCLPLFPGCRVLDLGCGTGLELESFFNLNPSAKITGIDMAPGMLGKLKCTIQMVEE